MTHYQYKGNSVIRMSSSVCHDVTNYVMYMWKPALILIICGMICYHTLSWSINYALQITKPEPKIEYPIVTISDRVEPNLEIIKKEKKK